MNPLQQAVIEENKIQEQIRKLHQEKLDKIQQWQKIYHKTKYEYERLGGLMGINIYTISIQSLYHLVNKFYFEIPDKYKDRTKRKYLPMERQILDLFNHTYGKNKPTSMLQNFPAMLFHNENIKIQLMFHGGTYGFDADITSNLSLISAPIVDVHYINKITEKGSQQIEMLFCDKLVRNVRDFKMMLDDHAISFNDLKIEYQKAMFQIL